MELVNRSQLAREIGVSPAAIAKAIKQKKLRLVGEGRTAKIDKHDVLTVKYIKDNSSNRQVAKQKKAEKEGPVEKNEDSEPESEYGSDEEGENAHLRDHKLKLQTKKLEIEMAEKLGHLLSRKEVEKTFTKLSSSIVSYIFPLGDRLAPVLASVFETTDQEKIAETKKTIDKEVGRALEAVKSEIIELLGESDG